MLSQENILELNTTGYLLIKNFLDEETLQKFKSIYKFLEKDVVEQHYKSIKLSDFKSIYTWAETDLLRNKNKRYLHKLRQVLWHTDFGKKFIMDLTKSMQLINPNYYFWKDKYMVQPPGANGYLPHQDNDADLSGLVRKAGCTLSIAFTPTTEETGCLWIENGPKRYKNLELCSANGCGIGSRLKKDKNQRCFCHKTVIKSSAMKSYNGYEMKPIPMNPGDCLFFDGWQLHGTALNTGKNLRKSLLFIFLEPKSEYLKDWSYEYHRKKWGTYSLNIKKIQEIGNEMYQSRM